MVIDVKLERATVSQKGGGQEIEIENTFDSIKLFAKARRNEPIIKVFHSVCIPTKRRFIIFCRHCPGTLPVALIVALGKAAELAARDVEKRNQRCAIMKEKALAAFGKVGGVVTGNIAKSLPSTLNISVPGLDSEAVILALKDQVAISNGSACTSQNYTASHVLTAMGLSEDHVRGALRFSWCHLTTEVDWDSVVRTIETIKE